MDFFETISFAIVMTFEVHVRLLFFSISCECEASRNSAKILRGRNGLVRVQFDIKVRSDFVTFRKNVSKLKIWFQTYGTKRSCVKEKFDEMTLTFGKNNG